MGAGVVEAAADGLCGGLACSSCLLSPHFSEAPVFLALPMHMHMSAFLAVPLRILVVFYASLGSQHLA